MLLHNNLLCNGSCSVTWGLGGGGGGFGGVHNVLGGGGEKGTNEKDQKYLLKYFICIFVVDFGEGQIEEKGLQIEARVE